MRCLNLIPTLWLCACLIISVIGQERISVTKCKSYGSANYIYDNLRQKTCLLPEIKNVVQGRSANLKQFPHLAIIGYRDHKHKYRYPCMGNLISENYILTTAGCVQMPNIGKPSKIRLGYFVENPRGCGRSQDIDIAEIHVHPEYNQGSIIMNDIALLKLKTRPVLNVYIRPACLYSNMHTTQTKGLFVGRENQIKSIEDVRQTRLLQTVQNILPNSKCIDEYPQYQRIRESQVGYEDDSIICVEASYKRPNHNCQGEAGSSLVLSSDKPCMFDIIGLSENDVFSSESEKPKLYTNVPYHLNWIESIVWPEDYLFIEPK